MHNTERIGTGAYRHSAERTGTLQNTKRTGTLQNVQALSAAAAAQMAAQTAAAAAQMAAQTAAAVAQMAVQTAAAVAQIHGPSLRYSSEDFHGPSLRISMFPWAFTSHRKKPYYEMTIRISVCTLFPKAGWP